MKTIIVHQEGVEKIELFDDEDGDIESFAQDLTKVLKGSTVSVIKKTDSALIVRTSKVISILIKDQSKTLKIIPKDVKGKKKAQKPKEKVDIITDVDK